jgi:NADP-dependent 3-hydroxy acid dehydrogenase YdfG
MAGSLDGTVALITGASSGIGQATARLVAEQGGLPVLSARRVDRLEVLAQELPGALAVQADVRDPEQVRQLVATTLEHHGRIDALINNAGQGLHLPLEQVSLDDLVAITELNFYAPLVALQAVLPVMRSQGSGAISLTSVPGHPVWCFRALGPTLRPNRRSTCSRWWPGRS